MKNTFLRKWFGFIILSVLSVTSVYARTVPLVIVAAETAQNMAFDTTQVITYTVYNNAPAPVMLNMQPSRTRVIPGSPFANFQITNDCVYRGMENYVPPHGHCNVSVAVTSGAVAGAVSSKVMINYGPTFQSIAPAPVLNFNVTGGGENGLFFTVAPSGTDMLINSQQVLTWTLSNTTGSGIALVPGSAHFTVASPLISPPIFTNDCGNNVPAHGICHVTTTINSLSTTGQVSQYLSVKYNTSSNLVVDKPTNFFIVSSANARTYTFLNECTIPVWFAFSGGGQGATSCKTDKDCDKYSSGAFSCGPGGVCFWKNPAPSDGNYRLAPLTGSKTITLMEHVYSPQPTQPMVWSGTIAGRTGCESGTCETSSCGETDAGGCPVGHGFQPPNMQSEPTLQTSTDFYDLTSINGLNLPMLVEPVNATIDPDNPYKCGSTGSLTAQVATGGTIGACSWTFTPPSQAYVWVAGGGGVCSINNDCNQGGGEACGLSSANIQAGSTQTTCGKFLGYWTGDQVCGMNNTLGAPFNCSANRYLYACSGSANESCYNGSNLTTCCGCINWPNIPSNGLIVPQCGYLSGACSSSTGNGSCNSNWISNVLPTIDWYKEACPPNYVYPYDDKSSTFTCSNSATANHVNYKVTFCPGGNDGAPAGTTHH